jgi:uncharacterized membrane protein YdjX (TVP38/TMEM64 family)
MKQFIRIYRKTGGWIIKSLPLIFTIAIFAGAAIAYIFSKPIRDFFHNAWDVLSSADRQRIEEWISKFSWWGPLVLLTLFLVQMFAFVIPSWALIVVSVRAYGPWWGSALAITGIALAATVAYVIGALLSEVTLRKLLGEHSEKKMKAYLRRYGFWLVTIFRLAPFLSNDIISYVAGLTSMTYNRFIAATLLGISPLVVLIAFLGETNERLKTGFVYISIISLAGFAAYVWWDRKHRPVE